MRKALLLLPFILFTSTLIAQKKKSSKMGQTTLEELKMTVYDKDSTAAAVVLYEHANIYLDPTNDYDTRTDYYYRIKILDKSAFDLSTVTLNLYKNKRILDLEAITYNISGSRMVKNHLLPSDVFTTKEGKNWTVKKFTLSNINEGSVIEYKYSILSPYLGLDDWSFQSEIPKIKSELDAAILGNYKYNVRLIGFLKLDKDNPSIDKKCVFIDGAGEGSCIIYSYGMDNIPAFKEEKYMLSKKNYISRISFDLESYTTPRGDKNRYTTTWEEADKKLKTQFFNNQTSKKSFFRNRIPDSILNTTKALDKAKKIYTFIQNHYTWNKKNWTNEDVKVKKAFAETTGNVGEINLSLYNSLRALDLEANLVVLSTRNNGVPTKLYPIIYDYNYVIVKINIDGFDYYLDATDKFSPFGQVPVRTLNGEARVISFEEEGNWVKLKPIQRTIKNIHAQLTLNNEGEFSGNLRIARSGYFASKHREKLALLSEESYLEEFEAKNIDLEVEDYKVLSENNIEKSIQEIFKVKMNMNESLGNKTRINPFLFDRIKNNPFKLKERFYPVDFAHPYKRNYSISINIPEGYKISQLPKNTAISLPNKGGMFILKSEIENNLIKIFTRFSIDKRIYSNEEYYSLKEFYKQIIISENSYLILEKKNK